MGHGRPLCKSPNTTQAEQLLLLRQRLDETQEVLQREQHRVQLLEAELLHLRSAQSACLYRRSGAYASASEVRHTWKPCLTMAYSESNELLPSAVRHMGHAQPAVAMDLCCDLRHMKACLASVLWSHLSDFSPCGGVK